MTELVFSSTQTQPAAVADLILSANRTRTYANGSKTTQTTARRRRRRPSFVDSTHLDCGVPLKDGGAASRTVDPRRKRGRRTASRTGTNRDGSPLERIVVRVLSELQLATAQCVWAVAPNWWCVVLVLEMLPPNWCSTRARTTTTRRIPHRGPNSTRVHCFYDSIECMSVCEQEPDSPGFHAHTHKQTHTTRPHGGGTLERKQAHTLLKGVAPKRKWALACVTCDVTINLEMLML